MNENKLEIMRHSLSHLMALSVKELWPNVKFAIGPAIDDGFYYDFDFGNKNIKEEDLSKIEKKMKENIRKDLEFSKYTLKIKEAIKKEKKLGQIYKVDLLKELKQEGEKIVSYYKLGDFEDLCKGDHINSLKEIDIDAFKISRTAGAYWKGDEKNKMLTRIYGIAFETKKELDDYLILIKEAEARDHRKLAKEFDYFSLSEKVGQGLILWHPNLSKVREVLETWWRKIHRQNDYDYIYSPHIGRSTLWETSGHLGFFKDSMYPPLRDKETNEEYYIKPMSCPFHVEIYNSKKRSYKELPLRWNELGTCYRYEKSGELHGLARPRGFTQDDAHVICSKEQFKEEYKKVVELTLKILNCFEFKKFKYYLAVRDPKEKEKYIGDPETWNIAENTIKEILNEKGLEFEVEEGGAKFYGPALDVKIFDAINREWQCPSIQLDMNLPFRFNMTYIGKDGKEHTPIMLHRAIFGSLERFCAILIEHYAGSFPVWLSPVQVKIISLSEEQVNYCLELKKGLLKKDIRVELDDSNETIGNKVRRATLEKVPYILVIGNKEITSGVFSVRERGVEKQRNLTEEELIKEIRSKTPEIE